MPVAYVCVIRNVHVEYTDQLHESYLRGQNLGVFVHSMRFATFYVFNSVHKTLYTCTQFIVYTSCLVLFYPLAEVNLQ